MRKIVLIIGIFGVLSVGMFISGCGEEHEECTCYHHYSGPGSEDLSVKVTSELVEVGLGCGTLNETTTSTTGLITTKACVD